MMLIDSKMRILENIFGVQIFSQLELLRRSLNVFEEEEIIENSLEEWKRYFHDVYGLTYLDKRWWINYRMFLVERFFECLHQGRPIGPFTIDIMRTVDGEHPL